MVWFPSAMNPAYRLFATPDSFAPTILRLVLAVVFAVHGGQKIFGWLGGPGWGTTLEQWTSTEGLNFSHPVAALGILAETLGALGLLAGVLTRLAALGIFCTMLGAIFAVHGPAGFLAPKGYEYPFTLAGVALALMLAGGGRWSVDRLITRALLPPNTGKLGSYRLPMI